MDDKGIIDLYFARDEKAIDETMKSYNGRLLRFASRFLSDPRDAEECVNDAYVRAWDTIPPNRPNNLFAYLAALCRNAALDVVKKNSAQKRSAQLVEQHNGRTKRRTCKVHQRLSCHAAKGKARSLFGAVLV